MSMSSISSTDPTQGSPPTSTAGSARPSVVRTAAVITHGHPQHVESAFERVRALAERTGVELVGDDVEPDIAIVLGGDGTMLRALARYLGTGVPVIGVNFGRVGFLSSMHQDALESGVRRVFAGEYDVVELATIEVEYGTGRFVAVNDAVVTSGTLGRMVELEWAV